MSYLRVLKAYFNIYSVVAVLFVGFTFCFEVFIEAKVSEKEYTAIAKVHSKNLLVKVSYTSEYSQENEPLVLKASVFEFGKPSITLEKEANSLGYTFQRDSPVKKLQHADTYRIHKFQWGTVYEWNTPTRGSAFYSYVCRHSVDYCVKVGRYTMIQLKWESARFHKIIVP